MEGSKYLNNILSAGSMSPHASLLSFKCGTFLSPYVQCNLCQLITEPTAAATTKANINDLGRASSRNFFTFISILPGLSDHFFVHFE